MSSDHINERINQIHFLILRKATGSRQELANRLGVSKGTLNNSINFMRDKLGAPIKYDGLRKTYYYASEDWNSAVFDKNKQIGMAMELLERMQQLQVDYSSFLKSFTDLK